MSVAAVTNGQLNPNFIPLVEKVSKIVQDISGNRLGEKQAYMVETRIKKRMMELGLKEANEYSRYIDANYAKESNALVGILTTHHTFFFREFPHFELLKERLPELVQEVKKRADKTIKVWSAACSRGHEVYSLAMFLDYHLGQIDKSISFKILGTDIDDESVSIANNGVYLQSDIKEIPMIYLSDNWAKGTGNIAQYAKIKSHLKSKCEFKKGNLLKINEVVPTQKFDIIFCRNVFIYFETPQVEKITKDLMSKLENHGIFFSGISEPLSGLKLELNSIGPSSYVLKTNTTENTRLSIASEATREYSSARTTSLPSLEIVPAPVLKVLCVDDSSSILTLMKKVLTKEHGFEVVDTAINGIDAMEKMKKHKVDLVTLDIHMPEMDGLAYLQKNFGASHPPVMIISSASRSDSDVAMRAFKLGASDFVEKPALVNLEERGEEIRTKLKTVYSANSRKFNLSSIDKEIQEKFVISRPEDKIRIVTASLNDLKTIRDNFRTLDSMQPPTLIFFEGQGEILSAIANDYKYDFRYGVEYLEDLDKKLELNKVYFVDAKHFQQVYMKNRLRPASVLVYGHISKHLAQSVKNWSGADILIEDLGAEVMRNHYLKNDASDVVPATSFTYMSTRFLSRR